MSESRAMRVVGYVECPHCSEATEYDFPALYGSGTVEGEPVQCEACGQEFYIEATVDVATRKVKDNMKLTDLPEACRKANLQLFAPLPRPVRKSRRLPSTPRSKVRQALRQCWLRSRERLAALKRDGYTCQKCGRKQSKAKGREFDVQVHHRDGIPNWEAVIDAVFAHILCGPEHLETLCYECHEKKTKEV